MGVIKRFAVGSIVLGVLAMAGGASALAFEDSGTKAPAVTPVEAPAQVDSDVESDVPAEELPDTGGPAAVSGWFAPNGR